MVDRHLITHIASAFPVWLFAIGLVAAAFGAARYLDVTDQIDIHEIDALYLTRLDSNQRGQYQAYRHHRVYPDHAARWVGEEQELNELKQWIKQHDLVIQAALSDQGAREVAGSIKNWLH